MQEKAIIGPDCARNLTTQANEIPESLQAAHQCADNVLDRLSLLVERINPILSNTPQSGVVSNSPKSVANSPMGNSLSELNDKLLAIYNKIDLTIADLQL